MLKKSLFALGTIGAVAIVGRPYFKGGVCNINKDLTGQVIVITGSNTGIGKETARSLAQMKATVILACRDSGKALAVVDEFKKENPNSNVEFMKLDLTDLHSIKDFVSEFKRKYQHLDILINNAGVMAIPEHTFTKDGFETQFGVNHLGHFYLTTSLLDTIKSSAPSRIINLSSRAQEMGKVEWDNLNGERNYNMAKAYAQSKLANVVFAKELQRRAGDANVKAVAVHPGVVSTELTRYVAADKWYTNLATTLYNKSLFLFGKNPVDGAQTTLYCALEEHAKLQGGAYYADCKVTSENPEASKPENGKRLWEESEKLISSKIAK